MRNLLGIALIVLTMSFGFSQYSMAVCTESAPDVFTCDTNPPNPDPNGVQQAGNTNNLTVNVLPGAGIVTGDNDDAIVTDDGNDAITVDNGSIVAGEGIETRDGMDVVNIIDSTLTSTDNSDDAVETGNDNDTVTFIRSVVTAGDDAASTGDGNDIVIVEDSSLITNTEALDLSSGSDTVEIKGSIVQGGFGINREGIECGPGNDIITVEDSRVSGGESIDCGTGNDLITFKTGANITDLINCERDFDTLVFAMDVPEDQVISLTNEIFFANPAEDSIEINGLTYEWIDCELLVAELNGVPLEPRPIPTLSEWGMIAMAGVIGIVGVLFAIRRKALVS